jgi:molybdopterin synthase sulfur carrier subunit
MSTPATAAEPEASFAVAPGPSLRVRLFAALREQAGWSERVVPLPADLTPVTAAAIWDQLELGPWSPRWRVAVNQEFAHLDQPLAAGDELAFLPPISGG